MIKCPNCPHAKLIQKKTENITFHYCQICRGALFNKDFVNDIMETAVELTAPKKAKYGFCECGYCRNIMKEFYYPQTFVTIDLCPKCHSLWLDKGELEEMELVRSHLKKEGKLELYIAEGSFKAKMLHFVNGTIKALTSF
jgi:Zn-finger nucleic acid-binding protein